MVVIPKLYRDPNLSGNVAFEGFGIGTNGNIGRAARAWSAMVKGAALAADAAYVRYAHGQQFQRWFGVPLSNAKAIEILKKGILSLYDAIRFRPITLAYTPDVQIKTAPEDRSQAQVNIMLPNGRLFCGRNVHGYVHRHLAGSGIRIMLGQCFMTDPDELEAAQTIYHELSHKVLETDDHAYGVNACSLLALEDPEKAMKNADSWGYFMKNFLTCIPYTSVPSGHKPPRVPAEDYLDELTEEPPPVPNEDY